MAAPEAIRNFKIQHSNFREISNFKFQPEALGTEFPKFEIWSFLEF
jgi:hypothetical protein